MMRTASFRRLARWLPEVLLFVAFLFFALRRIGTFPAAWADDSLFMLVAKTLALGHGYALPVLGWDWPRPYILAVGPTLILPVAAAIRLGGFSVAVARLPMTLYLLGSVAAVYLFVRRIGGLPAARWSAALLISLSAFINTGKPVLGEVPAFFFLMLGLILLQRKHQSFLSATGTGLAFGLAIITKLPFGLILPALAIAWIAAAVKREKREAVFLTVTAVSALLIALVGAYWMGLGKGFVDEMRIFLFEKQSVVPLDTFVPIIRRPHDLLRTAYAHYALLVLLAGAGWWTVRTKTRRSLSIIMIAVVALFAAYFLNGPGWYRALLPSTLLLTLFVPAGARRLAGKKGAVLLLGTLVMVQGYWQYAGHGSSGSTEAADAARVLTAQWRDRDLVFLSPEVFVRLPENPRWLFLSEELRDAERQPPELQQRLEQAKCLPVFRKESHEDLEAKKGTYTPVSGRYVVLPPPSGCAQ
ncbi:MAG: glycosyltransferase family 39 protein [Candidatus Peribacteraceae bacterium]|nr:glycosyltransferase family 39 protein [Candidatus Peribacteraceae bacterium]MDD5742210.1 glycosyltransferase family 39 protein [Candidatus Peribacteraceae bacterium]